MQVDVKMQKLWFRGGWLLCCMWALCASAFAADQQVIVEGTHRPVGAVRASGHDVSLLQAIEEVVPSSYSVNVPNAGPWADTPVSWRAGGSFVQVLGELLSGNPSLQARVDTDLRLVTVTAHMSVRQSAPAALPTVASGAVAANAASASASAKTIAQAPLEASHPASVPPVAGAPGMPLSIASPTPASASAASTVAPAASATPPERTVWELRRSDGSVRDVLARWASEAGWQFIWDVPTDFTIDATATIHGTFQQALQEVANALRHSQVPIQMVMYQGNRVLRVIPKGAG
ncbi:toxin co-regulated pilus biosynthesis Q family protein [Paraburkholderia humisilvae]|uniref:Toxin co-regulated pilus biosynthesis protein Q C-terminal domain-containing protein n=1 Tax=Paraburkholderia humisilvae TaxID=627669 RepID=A0A6J5F3E7_9BURK|nr:toxin co-regulated pilus biosynthesis Q family protein [Paraburkholderia humisilvae]CAB3772187.1 hypothetical protein LMG29542_06816 [Paraburkholderia humisilvae]